jgi:anti-sigma factor RsiW
MHDQWTDRLSEYLDGELAEDERRALETHLVTCEPCARTLDELRRVVAQAQSLRPHLPPSVLWEGVADRIGADTPRMAVTARQPHRVSFTVLQLAAASLFIAALAGGIVWRIRVPPRAATDAVSQLAPAATAPDAAPDIEPVSLGDAQYDAAVADLQRALDKGRGKLDATTIEIVEQNLKIVDQAIEQARRALLADPANTYLTGHLVETRRKKLNLLRRAAALTTETD